MRRKGFVLYITLAVMFLLTGSAMALMSAVSLESDIARNRRLHSAAKWVSQSGLAHFKALDLHYHDLRQMPDSDQRFLVLRDATTPNDSYEVYVTLLGDQQFFIDSIGTYNKKSNTPSVFVTRATFQTVVEEE